MIFFLNSETWHKQFNIIMELRKNSKNEKKITLFLIFLDYFLNDNLS